MVIKWAWRYHQLQMDTFNTVEEAVHAARSASDYGSESLDSIEVLENGTSRRLTPEEYQGIEDEQESTEEEPAPRIITHRLEVLHTINGPAQWVAYEWCESEAEATKAQDALLAEGFPPERTRIIAY